MRDDWGAMEREFDAIDRECRMAPGYAVIASVVLSCALGVCALVWWNI